MYVFACFKHNGSVHFLCMLFCEMSTINITLTSTIGEVIALTPISFGPRRHNDTGLILGASCGQQWQRQTRV